MTSIQSVQSVGMVPETTKAQDSNLPKDIQKDLQDLENALQQLKENPGLADNQNFQQKMLDYVNKYVEGYTLDVFHGTLSPDQQAELSDLNEDLKVAHLINAYYDGSINNPNTLKTIGPVLENLKGDWIDVINDAIDKDLGKSSK